MKSRYAAPNCYKMLINYEEQKQDAKTLRGYTSYPSILNMSFSSWKDRIRRILYRNNDAKQKTKDTLQMTARPAILQSKTKSELIIGNAICKDGTIMLFPTNPNGSQFILDKQNPNNLKSFTTDSHYRFVKKKEDNIEFWNVFSGDITYRSSGEHAKSCRLNMFASTTIQINDWKTAMDTGYIGSEKDLKNQEVTVIMRVHTKVGHKTECCIKMRGGGHHGDRPERAACIQLGVSTQDSGHSARWAKELVHPSYEYQDLEPYFEFVFEEGKWFGMKTTSWNNSNDNNNTHHTTTTNRCYIDPDPFKNNGTLNNDYRLYSEHIDVGNGKKYREIVNWAGGVPTTVRFDGFESVDFYACNAREIIQPRV
jgi:hypothetical protein